MLISLNWLKDFIDIPSNITAQKLAEDLTVHVVEVEEVINQAKQYENIVIGKIESVKKHPGADRLKLCMVDIGKGEPAQIVCGGLNVRKNMKCAVALPGAKVRWHGKGDLIELEEIKIRGEKSFGMICAANEIGLTDEHPADEPYVMDLNVDSEPGTSLAMALGLDDIIIDIDNKSLTNRPDLWGHVGIAREIATLYGVSLKEPEVKQNNYEKKPSNANVKVNIESEQLCRRFMSVRIDGVKVAESLPNIQKRLTAVGMRPINNIVDISNYVMLELGQPNHIFDAKKLMPNGENDGDVDIVVRNARDDETITTLDGSERKLDSSMLIIANKSKPLAIAGVMGGEDSEIDSDTTSIVIEVANFDPVSVRTTSNKLGLRTEASARFEKGLDPNLTEIAIERILDLLRSHFPKAKIGNITDVGDREQSQTVIETSVEFIKERLGSEVDLSQIESILKSLGFQVSVADGSQSGDLKLTVTVPTMRATGDISIPEDIVEEVARHIGYHSIKPTLPLIDTKGGDQTNRDINLERKVKRFLSLGAGFQEVENSAFDDVRMANLIGIDEKTDEVEIINPLSSDQQYLRSHLLPRLLGNVKDNLRYRNEFSIFEIGRVFKPADSSKFSARKGSDIMLPEQPRRLSAVMVSRNKDSRQLFFDMKGIVEGLFNDIGIDISFVAQNAHAWLCDSAELGIVENMTGDEKNRGEIGLLSASVVSSLKLDASVVVFYYDYELMANLPRVKTQYREIPTLPPVTRDIAVVVPRNVTYKSMEEVLKQQSGLLESYELFDLYEGSQIGSGNRSLAWHLSFRHPERTLTAEEADRELENIVNALKDKFGATLRSKESG